MSEIVKVGLMNIASTPTSQVELIMKNLDLTEDTKDFVTNCCFKVGTRYTVIQDGKITVEETGIKNFIEATFEYPKSCGEGASIQTYTRAIRGVMAIPSRHYRGYAKSIDLFAEKDYIELVDSEGEKRSNILVVQGGLKYLKKSDESILDSKWIQGYIAHAPYLEHLITAIVCNYINPQKNSFLAIQKPSSTGKSLELEALTTANLVYEVESGLDALVANGQNANVSADELVKYLSVAEDEFCKFDIKLKKLTYRTEITEKFKTPVRVSNLGLKLMFFADNELDIDPSDKQIQNRLVQLNYQYDRPLTNYPWLTMVTETKSKDLLARYCSYIAKRTVDNITKMASNPWLINRDKLLYRRDKEKKIDKFYSVVTSFYKGSISKMKQLQKAPQWYLDEQQRLIDEAKRLRAEAKTEAEARAIKVKQMVNAGRQDARFNSIMNCLLSAITVESDTWGRHGLDRNFMFPTGENKFFLRSPTKYIPAIIDMIEGKEASNSARRYRPTITDGFTHANVIERHTLKNRFKSDNFGWLTGIQIDFNEWESDMLEQDEDVPL